MAETTTTPNYLDPTVLNKVARLELRARLVMEGFVSGMHKSPFHGFSVEFAQHREYVQGDDLRYLDWKIWGKSDRLYIKEFEEETNLRAHLFLDQSESMAYGHEGGMTKFDYGATASASLAYLIQQQSDAVGLTLFNDKVMRSVPPSNTRANLTNVMASLEEATPTAKTRIGSVLTELASHVSRRGMVIVFSDLFDELEHVMRGLRMLVQRGHDVAVFHILDHDEVEFPFERMTLFDGLEELPELLVDPRSLRDAYLKEINDFQAQMRRGCLQNKIDYVKLVTSQPLDVVLSSYLAARAARTKRRK
ncbi:MAG: DUF58 domain-containing protein [Planctomycetota bacterium]|jgi:uncharacterized protein (DUF58 family)